MKLIIQRDQHSGLMGKVTFSLDIKADLTAAEQEYIRKYKMGKEVLYYKEKVDTRGIEMMGAWAQISRTIAARALDIKITVNDLVNGRHIECKDIIEMRAAEEQIKEACGVFLEVLDTAAHFGGTEVIEFERP